MKHFSSYLILLVAATIYDAANSDVFAQWSSDPTINTPISRATNGQQFPVIVSDGAGGAIIAWQDARSDNQYDIYAQHINESGIVQWTLDGIPICTETNEQSFLDIASDAAGGAIIVWQDARNGPALDIYAQRINASGIVQWGGDGVAISTATGYQRYPKIVSDGAGGAIITWEDLRNFFDIYAQRVNASGVVQWMADGVGICTADDYQYAPTIASDGASGAIITWIDGRSSTYDIYAQRINGAGAAQWTANGVAISTAANDQKYPTIVSDDAGGAIITWDDTRSGNRDIYAQHINASGALKWTANGVALCTAANHQRFPTICRDGAHGAIVAWYELRNGNNDVYAQRINASGAVQWTIDGVPISTTPEGQYYPALVSDDEGGAIITWYDERGGIGLGDVYAQRINASGAVQWMANGIGISTAAGVQNPYNSIASDGSGGAIITWWDLRPGGFYYDIYAQNINQDGSLGKSPCPSWKKRYNNSMVNKIDDMGFAIPTVAKRMTRNMAIDAAGCVYVTGYSDGGGTKFDYATIKYSPGGGRLWVARYDGPANKKDDRAYAIAVDGVGNVFVTGESDGGETKSDIATVKYDRVGVQQWVARYNNATVNKKDAGYAIALSPDGSVVYVTGETDAGSVRKSDCITIAYDAANGGQLWVTTYNGPGTKVDKAYAVAIDQSTGDVVIAGENYGGPSNVDYVTIKYSGGASGGAKLWAESYDFGHKKDYAFAVKIGSSGNVYVTGASEGSGTKFDYATVKYPSGGGAPVWVARYNNSINKNDLAYDITLDAGDNAYVTGASEGLKYDYVTVKYDALGVEQWVNRYDGGIGKVDIARSIAVCDNIAAVFVTGSSDQGAGRGLDFVTLRLNAASGLADWVGRYNGEGLKNDIGYSVALHRDTSSCCVVVTGSSDGGSGRKLDYATVHGSSDTPLPAAIITAASPDGDGDEAQVTTDDAPREFALNQSYPNPFNPTTTIRFNLAERASVTLKVYNVLGEEVATLIQSELMDEGMQEVEFDASRLASGVYFYRLVVEAIPDEDGETIGKSFTDVKKMLLLR